MRTLFIYSSFDSLPTFFILDGDYSHLNNVVINSDEGKEPEELSELLFDQKTGEDKIDMQETFPLGEKFDKVANCGFAP